MLISLTPGFIVIEVNDKKVEFPGDLFFIPEGGSGFATDIMYPEKWMDGSIISEDDRKLILETMQKDFKDKGMQLDIEFYARH